VKRLIAGPWVGEFGWELFAWQGYIRALSEKFDETTIISRKNSEAFYEDFAHSFVAYESNSGLPDAFFMHNLDILSAFKEIVTSNNIKMDKDTALVLPRRIGIPPHTHHTDHVIFGNHPIQPKYVCFGQEEVKQYDYIFHIRSRELRKEDNWSLENWNKLKKLLGNKKIACIGTKKEAAFLDGTDDLRDLEMKKLVTILRNSSCAFGPSSGPMHLASLCGLPHVVWSIPQNKVRYEENWNPLNTKVLFDCEYKWHPSADYVYKKFKENLR
jgi:hypothetical protein